MNYNKLFAAMLVFVCALSAHAQSDHSLVLPRTNEVLDGTATDGGGSSLLRDRIRIQEVYNASLFPSNKVLLIKEIRFRPASREGGAFSTTISNLQINLSTTAASANNLSAVFANNVGFDDSVVFRGLIAVSSAFTGPNGGPKDFDIVIPFTTPFRFDPTQGNLLVDIRNHSGSSSRHVDAGGAINDGASRAIALDPNDTTAITRDKAAEVIQLVYTEEDPSPRSLTFDVSRDFSITSNPNGAWTYGYTTNLGGVFNRLTQGFDHLSPNGVPLQLWAFSSFQGPAVYHNSSPYTATSDGGQGVYPPGTTWFQTGDWLPQDFGVIRLTIPAGRSGTYRLESAVRSHLDGPSSGDNDYYVLRNGVQLFGQVVPPNSSAGYSNTFTLNAGDTIDFVVGRGPDGLPSALKIRATVNAVSTNPPPPPANTFDAADQFSLVSNPSGAWSYGYENSLDGPFNLFTARRNLTAANGVPVQSWAYGPSTSPAIYYNASSQTATTDGGSGVFPPGTLWLEAGWATTPANFGVLRFTVPSGSGGTYRLQTMARPHLNGLNAPDSQYYVVRNGTVLFNSRVLPETQVAYSNLVSLASGDTVDFVIGRGPNNQPAAIKLEASLDLVSTNQPPPPPPPGNTFDAADQFSLVSNPNGPWSYGYENTLGGAFGLLSTPRHLTAGNGVEILSWALGPTTAPGVYYNATTQTAITDGGRGVFPPGTLFFEVGWPHMPENFGVVRFTVPSGSSGTYRLETSVRPHFDGPTTDSHYYVLRNGLVLFNSRVLPDTQVTYSNLVGLVAGDTVDFVIGRGLDNQPAALKLEARLVQVTTNQPPPPPPSGNTFDVADQFSLVSNPSDVWSYGYENSLNGTLTLFATRRNLTAGNGVPVQSWAYGPFTAPAVYYNASSQTATTADNGVFPPGTLWLEVGWATTPANFGVVRFTAPTGGTYRLETTARPHLNGPSAPDSHYYVVRNGTVLFDSRVLPETQVAYSNLVSLASGDTVDFVIGRGPNDQPGAIKLEASLNLVSTNQPPPPPSGPALVVPAGLHSREGNGGSASLSERLRLQEVYRASDFPTQSVRITELRFRPSVDAGTGAFSDMVSNIVLKLSTTTRQPDRLSSTFAENIGNDETVVYDGTLPIQTRFTGSAPGPKEFDIVVPLQRPFVYNPAVGNLLLDIQNLSGAPLRYVVDAEGASDGASRIIAHDPLATTAVTTDSGADVLQIVYSTTNQPPPPPPSGNTFDVADQFSLVSNPSGVWSYGYENSLNGPFNLFTARRNLTAGNGVPIQSWAYGPSTSPAIYYNASSQTATTDGGSGVFPPGTLWLEAGWATTPANLGVVRFTAPTGGTYRLQTMARPHLNGPSAPDSHYYVVRNGTVLFNSRVLPETQVAYSNLVSLASGDTVDFAIGRGPSDQPAAIKLEVSLDLISSNLPPVVRITSPRDGEVFRPGGEIRVEALTEDRDGYAPLIELFIDGRKVGEQIRHFIQPPPNGTPIEFAFLWPDSLPGNYALTAKATDNHNAARFSDPVRIVVGEEAPPPPTNDVVVTISASDGFASEGLFTNCFVYAAVTNEESPGFVWRTNCVVGSNTAAFVVHRRGPTDKPLTVNLRIGGTASNGVDYASILPQVTIPAGASSSQVLIVPADDGVVEEVETVVLQLAAGIGEATYRVGWPESAAVVIGDGRAHELPSQRLADGCFHLRLPGRNGDRVRIEASHDMVNWVPINTTTVTDGACHFVDPDAHALPRRFYRAVPDTEPAPE